MRKMTQGSIVRHLIAYALPLILGNLFQLTYNAVDSIVIGKFAGENALAAVSAANPVMTIMILGVSGVSIGASVLMSRFYGAGDEDALRREVATTIVFGGVASVAAFLLGWPLSGPVLRLMRVPGEILAMATRYLQVIFVGFLFTFQYNILAAALRSVGDSKTPAECIELLTKWKEAKAPIRVIITDTNINLIMGLKQFDYSERDGSRDVYYTLSFIEYKELNTPMANNDKQTSDETGLKERASDVETPDTVTLADKANDVLDASKKVYGDYTHYRNIIQSNNLKDLAINNIGKLKLGERLKVPK